MPRLADPLALAVFGLLFVTFVLLVLLVLMWRALDRAPDRLDEAKLGAFVAASLKTSGLSEDLGQVKHLASEMSQATQGLRRVFEVQQQRGLLGELQLEAILADLVPPDRLQIRKNVPLLGTPDAAIRIRNGLVCVDSKFPLDQYREMQNGPQGEREKRSKQFVRAVRGHLEEIAGKYVRPDAGSAPYAVAFIPSESVYTYLHQAEPGLGQEFAKKGVLLASPSTLTTHVALIVMGVQAEVLSERVELVQHALHRIDRELGTVRDAWDIMRKHVKNANEQTTRLEHALNTLDDAYRAARSLEAKGDEEPPITRF